MSGNRRWILPALAGLVALTGCGREPSVASRSAAAFEEARKQGKTFAGAGHDHGEHGHAPAEDHETPDAAPAAGGEHQHGMAQEGDHSAMGHGGGQHAGHAPDPGAGQHAGHGSPAGTRPSAAGQDHAGHSPPVAPRGEHAGHAQPAAPAHDHAAPRPAAPGQDHAGHSGGGTPSPTAPELPAQPAGILKPDPLDAPAATSVLDSQRSAEMAREMSGGHGGHGSGTYRQIDAGRGPGAYEGSEPQTPGAGPQHHDHGGHAPASGEKKQAALYVCPMHPEVTSNTPGTCPKCGMALVERREE